VRRFGEARHCTRPVGDNSVSARRYNIPTAAPVRYRFAAAVKYRIEKSCIFMILLQFYDVI